MLGTELLKGQGLGNALFCYVTTRCLAKKHQEQFAILGQDILAGIANEKTGLYFMTIDFGEQAEKKDFSNVYQEKDDRIFLGNSKHDRTIGCYITGADYDMIAVRNDTLIYGNMQDEKYFFPYKEEIKKWLCVKPEYDSMEYCRDNLCIINIRGREYTGSPELYLNRAYWLKGIRYMRNIRKDMEFMIITDDIEAAGKVLPELPAYHFSLDKDYATIKNAKYLLLSNSSFAFFPTFTSDTVKVIVAPKYWARYNVSDGYWASEQNIYTGWNYMDRNGKIFSAEECREELQEYKKKSHKYKNINKKPIAIIDKYYRVQSKWMLCKAMIRKIAWGVIRKCKKRMGVYNCQM